VVRPVSDGWLLARVLRTPTGALALDAAGWTALLAIARAEQMIGTLAARLDGLALPDTAARILADARVSAAQGQVAALWEVEAARRSRHSGAADADRCGGGGTARRRLGMGQAGPL
jgi:hypothetical protein